MKAAIRCPACGSSCDPASYDPLDGCTTCGTVRQLSFDEIRLVEEHKLHAGQKSPTQQRALTDSRRQALDVLRKEFEAKKVERMSALEEKALGGGLVLGDLLSILKGGTVQINISNPLKFERAMLLSAQNDFFSIQQGLNTHHIPYKQVLRVSGRGGELSAMGLVGNDTVSIEIAHEPARAGVSGVGIGVGVGFGTSFPIPLRGGVPGSDNANDPDPSVDL